jgi:amino acid adenylation domain-containing protein/thioester reductase-like protein
LFTRQAKLTPQATALISAAGQMTYAELDERSNQLAAYLRRMGVGPEVRVGVCLRREAWLAVGVLGVLKAGGAYVALDAQYPMERVQWMMEDAAVAVVVTEEELVEELPAHWAQVVSIDGEWERIAEESAEGIESGVTGDNLAYIIYTSGSTGQPKGVLLQHHGLSNLVEAQAQVFNPGEGDRVLQFASLSFDASVFELAMALASGATLCFIDQEQLLPGPGLVQIMNELGITNVTLPPSVLAALPDDELPALKTIISAGEALTSDLVERWGGNRRIFNAYGPTETTIWASVSACVGGSKKTSIGQPIANTRIYLLDEHSNPVPVGVAGELHIAGVGLARGYVNLPATTAEKFVPDPFSSEPGQRLYKTGDIAHYLPDGNIMFVGRADNQVKVRGFRIELGEVEAALKQLEDVSDTAVVARESPSGDKVLVAYVVPASGHDVEERELRTLLKQRLPEYLIPTTFVMLAALPLTTSGKIDRQALPDPSFEPDRRDKGLVLPRTETEKLLVEIWSQVLDRKQISIHDNFFDLGGHSLLVAKTIYMIQESLGVELPMRILFEAPSLAKLAEVINTAREDGIEAALASITAIDPNDEAVLDESIYPDGTPVDLDAEPERIFLTGATGFLGVYLLRDLMEQTQAEIHCLVRCSDEAEGRERIRQTLDRYLLPLDPFDSRIVIWPGDISKPFIGVTEEGFQKLAHEMDAIYHCATLVNFLDPYYRLKAANVQGTQEIIKLACRDRVKPLHYVSSLASFVAIGHTDDGIFREDHPLERWQHPGGGYAQSKWISERMVLIARSRGLPATIFRPGPITGDSQTGAWNSEDFMCRLLMGCIQLGSAPYASSSMPFTPVDFVSKTIIYLSRQKEAFSKIYHLTNPKPGTAATLVRHISSLGYPLRFIWFDEWQEALFSSLEKTGNNALSKFVPMFERTKVAEEVYTGEPRIPAPLRPAPPQADSMDNEEYGQLIFDCKNTMEALEGTSIVCPPVNRELIKTYLSYFVRIGLLEEPHTSEMLEGIR